METLLPTLLLIASGYAVWLKLRDPNSGVRDFEAVNRLAASHGLYLLRDIAMPSNNRMLIWRAHDSA